MKKTQAAIQKKRERKAQRRKQGGGDAQKFKRLIQVKYQEGGGFKEPPLMQVVRGGATGLVQQRPKFKYWGDK
jgi:hypothetical protein